MQVVSTYRNMAVRSTAVCIILAKNIKLFYFIFATAVFLSKKCELHLTFYLVLHRLNIYRGYFYGTFIYLFIHQI